MKRVLITAAIVAGIFVPGTAQASPRGTSHPIVCRYVQGPASPRTGLPTIYRFCKAF